MSSVDPSLVRLSELAVDQITGELADEEAAEYQRLRDAHREFDVHALEHAAAALHLAAENEYEALPERLRIRLATRANEFFAGRWREMGNAEPVTTLNVEARGMDPRMGWWAAAACLIVALGSWFTRPASTPTTAAIKPPAPAVNVAASTVPAVAVPAAGVPAAGVPAAGVPESSAPRALPATPAEEREQLLAGSRTVVVRPWRAGNDPTGTNVSGDVAWDAAGQRGFLRFSGLRRNNPNVEQYQLWIFDARRDERYPVDGGVFNITHEDGEEVVAIKPALKIGVALTFAVTLERPGGVVVSDRSRIAALANTG
jgi:hypothetical protein